MKYTKRNQILQVLAGVIFVILVVGILALAVHCSVSKDPPAPEIPAGPSYEFEFDNYHLVA